MVPKNEAQDLYSTRFVEIQAKQLFTYGLNPQKTLRFCCDLEKAQGADSPLPFLYRRREGR